MNREIIFRGKRVDNGEWVEGYLFDDGYPKPRHVFVGGLVINEYKGTACDEWDINAIDFADVEPDTICQYTGLTDKNGKKIFEGDILRYGHDNIGGEVKFGLYEANFSEDNQGFYVEFSKNSIYRKELGYWRNKAIVIGNIYDNPELLEEENVHGTD